MMELLVNCGAKSFGSEMVTFTQTGSLKSIPSRTRTQISRSGLVVMFGALLLYRISRMV